MKIDLSNYKCAVFDCDCVILDSNQLKIDAFRVVLENEATERVDAFIAYHQSTGGISRYAKFKTFYADMLKVPDAAARADSAIRRYGEEVRKRLFTCATIPGVERVLEVLCAMDTPCAVNSGGDQDEICDVFSKRRLDRYFKRILGSPATKSENMARLADGGFFSEPGIFFGDARSDLEAAQAFGLDFVFVANASDWQDGRKTCRLRGHPVVRTFEDIL